MNYSWKNKFVQFGLIFTIFLVALFGAKIKIDEYSAERLAKQAAAEAAAAAQAAAKKALDSVNPEHLRCLATNIYHEAAGEPFMGQVAVARVVMNRIKYGFASNPCKVIYQTTKVPDDDSPDGYKKICQFSWVCEGKTTPNKNANYLQAEYIARNVLAHNKWKDEIPGNILFFHANSVDPGWNYRKTMVIGNHIFYSKGKQN